MPDSVYLDACVFIEVLQKDLSGADAARVDACCDLVRRAKKKELTLVSSALMITEVNKLEELGKKCGVLPEEQSKKILDFFENEYIHIRQVDRETAESAHHLTRTHLLGNIDAIHVATALKHKCVAFYTYDGARVRGRKGLLKHDRKIGSPPLRIECPPPPSSYPLFDLGKPEGSP